MADRTLVAYERDGGYDTYYAHDGVDGDALGPDAPDEGGDTRDLTRLRDVLADRGIELGPCREGPAVDPDPLATGLPWDAVAATLDYGTYDRCLRVAADGAATAFIGCWFGFAARGGEARDPVGDGALLAVDGDEEPFVRGWFEGVKSATADGLRCDLVDEDAARSYLAGRLRSFAGTREVVVPDG